MFRRDPGNDDGFPRIPVPFDLQSLILHRGGYLFANLLLQRRGIGIHLDSIAGKVAIPEKKQAGITKMLLILVMPVAGSISTPFLRDFGQFRRRTRHAARKIRLADEAQPP